jgi:NADPH2:quinone reductase
VRSARVHEFGALPTIVEEPAPAARAGRTLVALRAATVGHIDATIWGGRFLRHPPLPYVPGVEAAGVVLESDEYAAGQRVWVRGGGLGTAEDGTWREVVDAPTASCGPLADAVPWAVGAAFFSPTTSAWVALHDVAVVRPGERVLVTGAAGAVGMVAVQLAAEHGAVVTGSASSESRAALVPSGAHDVKVVDPSTGAVTPGEPFDVVIDTVGGAGLAALLPQVAPGGRVVVVGYLAGTAVELDLAAFCQRDVALLPLNMMRREPAGRAAAPELLARLGSGSLLVEVTELPFASVDQAFDRLADRSLRGRLVLVMNEQEQPT